MISESNEKLSDPYKESVRIAYTAEDTNVAQKLQKDNEEIMAQFTTMKPYNSNSYGIRMMCQSAINRYLNTRLETRWSPKYSEIDLFQGEETYRMSVRSRVVYGRLDNGWVEIIDEPIKTDGFIFCCFNRHVGIIFLLGYITKKELEVMINDYREGNDNGITYIKKGQTLSKGAPATRPFWRIPYSMVTRFPHAESFGDFEQAKVDVIASYEQYPIPPRPNETKSN